MPHKAGWAARLTALRVPPCPTSAGDHGEARRGPIHTQVSPTVGYAVPAWKRSSLQSIPQHADLRMPL